MQQDVNANATTPFLLIQKPQELIRLFENLIDQKIKEKPPAHQLMTL